MSFIDDMFSIPTERMKNEIIPGDEREYSIGLIESIDEHVDMLRSEFVGQSTMNLYHAVLIVLIRRKVDLKANRERFVALWEKERGFLVKSLDSRWLVSACDTIIDWWPDRSERALALAGSLFANMIKLYETERWAAEWDLDSVPRYRRVEGRVALHDGMSAFLIGRGDMIANLYRRARSFEGSVSSDIVTELLDRASRHDTVLKRFKDVHRNSTAEW